jgi:hypothetical protein
MKYVYGFLVLAIAPIALIALLAVSHPGWLPEVRHPYPSDVEASFRQSYSNLPSAIGECVLAQTERQYTYAQFQAIANEYGGTGTQPPAIQAIVVSCTAGR